MKNIILTGSSSGFGLLTAKTLAKKGYTVFATMRNISTKNAVTVDQLRAWALENHVNIIVIEMDVTSDASVEEAMGEISDMTGGHIDVLINNAGSAYVGLNETLSASQTNLMFQVNVIGADRMIKAVLPYMHRRKSGQIISLSSVMARQPIPVMGIYSATKAALDALSVSYYYELRGGGIDITILQPGAFPTTDIISNQMEPHNPSAKDFYGEEMLHYVSRVEGIFEAKPESANPQIVADKIAELINSAKEDRSLWSIIEGGPLSQMVDQQNQATRKIIDTIVTAAGI